MTVQAEALDLLRELQHETQIGMILFTCNFGVARRRERRAVTMAEPLLVIRDPAATHPVKALRESPFLAPHDASSDILAGEAGGLVGESGSGKTTLRRAVLGRHMAGLDEDLKQTLAAAA